MPYLGNLHCDDLDGSLHVRDGSSDSDSEDELLRFTSHSTPSRVDQLFEDKRVDHPAKQISSHPERDRVAGEDPELKVLEKTAGPEAASHESLYEQLVRVQSTVSTETLIASSKPGSADHFSVSDQSSADAGKFQNERQHAPTTKKGIVKAKAIYASLGRFEGVQVPPRAFPKSSFMPTAEPDELTEVEALLKFQNMPAVRDNCTYAQYTFTSINLTNFCVYSLPRPPRNAYNSSIPEFIGPQELYAKQKDRYLIFDGILEAGNQSCYVRGVPFNNISIGCLDDLTKPVVGRDIWLASRRSGDMNTWYRLCDPEPSYRPFYTPFIWIATFCKHVVDFLSRHDEATFHDFAVNFNKFVVAHHSYSLAFRSWWNEYGQTDFRRPFAASWQLMEAQANDMGLLKRPLWAEVKCRSLHFHEPTSELPKTVVTPFVYKCFKESWFGSVLRFVEPVTAASSFSARGETPKHAQFTTRRSEHQGHEYISSREPVRVGDVVMVEPDNEDVSNWKGNTTPVWYAYVLGIAIRGTRRCLNVLWLDAPSHTTIATAPFLYENELFLSDHCNCDTKSGILFEDEILGFAAVTFFAQEPLSQGYFVRQVSLREECAFRTLTQKDFACPCSSSDQRSREWSEGDTVLVASLSMSLLEPCILMQSTTNRDTVRALQLLRRTKLDISAVPNEVLYCSEEEREIEVRHIVRDCYVRIFAPDVQVPAPYSARGVGNLFFVQYGYSNGALAALPPNVSFKQSFDPDTHRVAPLPTLDLFCGCGNLGFGIEEAGAAKVVCAVDMAGTAIHTYQANLNDPKSCLCYWGSVDNLLLAALEGNWKQAPHPGKVGLILAGCPCQGFSSLNRFKFNPRSLKNISMIASLMAYADFYRPRYLIVENVVSMTNQVLTTAPNGATIKQNAFSYIVACLVSMGYQVQQINGDACIEGAPQSRKRIFIIATAPGFTPLDPPGVSHHYPTGMASASLGSAPNGDSIAKRDLTAPKPFNFVSIGAAVAHLPKNLDGRYLSVAFPDHIPVEGSYTSRALIENIPRFSTANAPIALDSRIAQTFLRAAWAALLNNPTRNNIKSNSFRRMDADKLAPCIMATCSQGDARTGRIIHWEQNRSMTIEEARISQQIPHEFVLLGSPRERWKMVGNAVARGLSQSLGISLRRAIEADQDSGTTVQVMVSHQSRRPVWAGNRSSHVGSQRAETPPKRKLVEDHSFPATDQQALHDECYSGSSFKIIERDEDDAVSAGSRKRPKSAEGSSVHSIDSSPSVVNDMVRDERQPRVNAQGLANTMRDASKVLDDEFWRQFANQL